MSKDKASSSPRLITSALNEILETGATAVLATVVESRAASVVVGAKMIVSEDRNHAGSLGKGQLDEAVARFVSQFLKSRDETKLCGVQDLTPELAEFADVKILFERIEAEPQLVIAGAGHVGASLARLAARVGFQVKLVDDRAEFVGRHLFSEASDQAIKLIAADDWQAAMREAIGNGRGVSVAIVTRGHKQDEECLRAAVEARPDYVGMIGSKRRTNIVLDKLSEEGCDRNELKKVRAPIGLDIGAVSPEEVALAILAEIVAERRGASGAPLSRWRRS